MATISFNAGTRLYTVHSVRRAYIGERGHPFIEAKCTGLWNPVDVQVNPVDENGNRRDITCE